ncbi:MAG: hypothetical protein GX051_07835 [Clostridiales bacterium]|nr:hypothetical protein [Clostridiales bacterium]
MKKKLSALSLILAAILLLSGCLGSETAEPTTTSGPDATQAKLFFDTQTPLALGYKLCYTNPQEKEDPTEKSNVYGIAAEDGSVIIAPQYDYIRPTEKNRFLISKKTSETFSREMALINEKNEVLIPFAEGSIYDLYFWDGTSANRLIVQRVSPKNDLYYLADNDGNIISEIYDYMSFGPDEEVYGVKNDYFGKCVFVENENAFYLVNFEGETVFTFTEQPQATGTYFETDFVQTMGLKNGSVRIGITDKNNNIIVPCEYIQAWPLSENRFLAWNGSIAGIESCDTTAIYDATGKIICPEGKFLSILFRRDANGFAASTGIAYELNDGGKAPELCYLVNQDGKKLTGAYESLNANDDGSFTAVKDGKTVTLTADGKVA